MKTREEVNREKEVIKEFTKIATRLSIALVIIIALAICIKKVPTGHVGVVYNLNGGVDHVLIQIFPGTTFFRQMNQLIQNLLRCGKAAAGQRKQHCRRQQQCDPFFPHLHAHPPPYRFLSICIKYAESFALFHYPVMYSGRKTAKYSN